MKRFMMLSLAVTLSLTLSACGMNEGEAGETGSGGGVHGAGSANGGTDAGTTVTNPPAGTLSAPFRTTGQYVLEVARDFIDNSDCAEIVGNLPAINWQTGIIVSDKRDNFLRASYSMAYGTYDFSYRAVSCTGRVQGKWADYGDKAKLANIPVDARKWIVCTWYDPANRRCVATGSPTCNLRLSVDYSGNITPAGSMDKFSPSDPGCQ